MTTRKTTRRDFLIGGLAAGAGLGLMGGLGGFNPLMHLAHAEASVGLQGQADRCYIFCYFGGGWDILLSLDPRDPDAYTEQNVASTRILPGYGALNTDSLGDTPVYYETDMHGKPVQLGAYLGELATVQKYREQIAIVRGINMETLSHDTGRRRFNTGKPPAGVQARGSSAATWLASRFGKDNLIPNLALRVESFNVDQPTYASGMKFSSVSDMLEALRPTEPIIAPKLEKQLDELLIKTSQCHYALDSKFYRNAEAGRLKAQGMVSSGLEHSFDFLANSVEMAALRDRFGFSKNTNGLGTAQARAALAAKAITSGVARCVSVAVAGGGLDTHYDDWTTDQGPRQMVGFNNIARIIDELSETPHPDGQSSWMDHTNIVAFSEFSRTPMINARGGRDHWLNNACLLLGPDVKGGTIVGASSNVGMEPEAIDLSTGKIQKDGTVLNPEHVLQTLIHGAGFTDDPVDLRCEPIAALMP